jgi:hypothetical protein
VRSSDHVQLAWICRLILACSGGIGKISRLKRIKISFLPLKLDDKRYITKSKYKIRYTCICVQQAQEKEAISYYWIWNSFIYFQNSFVNSLYVLFPVKNIMSINLRSHLVYHDFSRKMCTFSNYGCFSIL